MGCGGSKAKPKFGDDAQVRKPTAVSRRSQFGPPKPASDDSGSGSEKDDKKGTVKVVETKK